MLDETERSRLTARTDVDVAAGKSAPRTNVTVRRYEIELENVELVRVGMERRYDRLGSEADFDAHSMGYENWVQWCTRAMHAKKIEMSSKAQKSATGGQEKIVGERADGLQSGGRVTKIRRWMVTSEVEWRRVASSGGWQRWLVNDLADFGGRCENNFDAQIVGCCDDWLCLSLSLCLLSSLSVFSL